MTMRPISAMLPFEPAQLSTIDGWLEDHSLRETVVLIREQFQKTVPRMSLQRYQQRLDAKAAVEEEGDLQEEALAFQNFAAKGEVNFNVATLEVIKRAAFKKSIAGDYKTVKLLFGILNQTTNTETRQRLAAVQEAKQAQRRERPSKKTAAAPTMPVPPDLTDDSTEEEVIAWQDYHWTNQGIPKETWPARREMIRKQEEQAAAKCASSPAGAEEMSLVASPKEQLGSTPEPQGASEHAALLVPSDLSDLSPSATPNASAAPGSRLDEPEQLRMPDSRPNLPVPACPTPAESPSVPKPSVSPAETSSDLCALSDLSTPEPAPSPKPPQPTPAERELAAWLAQFGHLPEAERPPRPVRLPPEHFAPAYGCFFTSARADGGHGLRTHGAIELPRRVA